MNPHESAAQTRAAGWQVLPLPRGQKFPPPSGYTGREGAVESLDVNPGMNYAIRLPDGVVGIDVDHGYLAHGTDRVKHGADTMMALIQRLGALPATYVLSSREDRRSGQRFYRVPVGTELLGELPAEYGPDGQHSDVEIIQHRHRYAVGPGSVVDGREYTLTGPGGAPMSFMPPADTLPMLPTTWLRALASTTVPVRNNGVTRVPGDVPARQLTFTQANEAYSRAVLEYGTATTPGFNAKAFKFLAVSRAFWMAQGMSVEQWRFTTAEQEMAAHPYYREGGIWAGLDATDIRVIGEVADRSNIRWQLVDEQPDATPNAPGGVYIIDEPWDCVGGHSDPLTVARTWLTLTRQQLHHWRGTFYRYSAGRWKSWEDGEIHRIMYNDLQLAFFTKVDGRNGAERRIDHGTKPDHVNAVLKALAATTNRQSHWSLDKAVVFENGSLDLTTGQLVPHTSKIFNVHKIMADYDPSAICPVWDSFLSSSLPQEDQQAVLQEMFGYLLSGRQDLQKIFGLWGQPRTGKSTTARTLLAILGDRSFTSTRYMSLVGPFGLQGHAESSVIYVTEARITKDNKSALPLLLAISGNDTVDVNVKNKPQYSARLPGRLIMAANSPPTAMDDSDAFPSRFVHVLFNVSFLDREDHNLEDKLKRELPGIVAWGLRGLARLNEQGGHFTKSASHMAAYRQMAVASSNVPTWFKDRVLITADQDDVLTSSTLFGNYVAWCAANDVPDEHVSSERRLGSWLTERLGGPTEQVWISGHNWRARRGLRFQ